MSKPLPDDAAKQRACSVNGCLENSGVKPPGNISISSHHESIMGEPGNVTPRPSPLNPTFFHNKPGNVTPRPSPLNPTFFHNKPGSYYPEKRSWSGAIPSTHPLRGLLRANGSITGRVSPTKPVRVEPAEGSPQRGGAPTGVLLAGAVEAWAVFAISTAFLGIAAWHCSGCGRRARRSARSRWAGGFSGY